MKFDDFSQLTYGTVETNRIQDLACSFRSVTNTGFPDGSVAVIVNFFTSLFGGPLSQLLKCLTAIKVCAELAKAGVAAVPVCWIRPDPPRDFPSRLIYLLDRRYELHRLELSETEPQTVCGSSVNTLFNEIEKIFPEGCDEETLTALRRAFSPDMDFSSANAAWIEILLKEWGARVWNDTDVSGEPICLLQSQTFPVAAVVVDAHEIPAYAGQFPLILPRCRATIISARLRKTLERYNVDFNRLFAGKTRVMESLRSVHTVPDRLAELTTDVRDCLNNLEIFDARNARFAKIRKTRGERIVYQLEKTRRHYLNAVAAWEHTADARIHKACNAIAPFSSSQEDVIGGIQIPLRYGQTGLRILYEKLDIRKFEHQLIEMD